MHIKVKRKALKEGNTDVFFNNPGMWLFSVTLATLL